MVTIVSSLHWHEKVLCFEECPLNYNNLTPLYILSFTLLPVGTVTPLKGVGCAVLGAGTGRQEGNLLCKVRHTWSEMLVSVAFRSWEGGQNLFLSGII